MDLPIKIRRRSIHFISATPLLSRIRWRKNVLRRCSNPANKRAVFDGQQAAATRRGRNSILALKRNATALGMDDDADFLLMKPAGGPVTEGSEKKTSALAADQTSCVQSSKRLASPMKACKVGDSTDSNSPCSGSSNGCCITTAFCNCRSGSCTCTINLDVPLLPLRRRSSAMKLARTRRWRNDALGKPPEPGFETRGDRANVTLRRHQRRRVRQTRPLLFGVRVPGWSASIVLFLGASPGFARPLASVDREALAVLLRDAQQVCAELRPRVIALARARAWHTREELELAYTRNLVGVLAALVPLEWRKPSHQLAPRGQLWPSVPCEQSETAAGAAKRQQRQSTEQRAGLLMEIASDVHRARICRVQRLLDTLASSFNQSRGLPAEVPR